MFNIIMRHYDWNDTNGVLDSVRMFENTDGAVRTQFMNGNSPAFDQLSRLPCLLIPEGTGDQICRVGRVVDARVVNDEVRFRYAVDPDVPPIRNSLLFQHKNRLDMNRQRNNFDWHRNHWAVKDVDLYEVLFGILNPRRHRPTVFNIADFVNINQSLMSVMMPFDAGFTKVYAAIQNAGLACNLAARRADEIWEAAGIIQDVVNLIDRARIVVCDLTGRNPNVFYEAGIAHSLGREVILITQNEHDVPFDLRHLRYIRYHNNSEGLISLTTELQNRINTLIGGEEI